MKKFAVVTIMLVAGFGFWMFGMTAHAAAPSSITDQERAVLQDELTALKSALLNLQTGNSAPVPSAPLAVSNVLITPTPVGGDELAKLSEGLVALKATLATLHRSIAAGTVPLESRAAIASTLGALSNGLAALGTHLSSSAPVIAVAPAAPANTPATQPAPTPSVSLAPPASTDAAPALEDNAQASVADTAAKSGPNGLLIAGIIFVVAAGIVLVMWRRGRRVQHAAEPHATMV